MSDQDNLVPVETVDVAKPPYECIEKSFSGEAEGFKFTIIQVNSVLAAINKWGEDTVRELINSAVAFAMRNKAKGKLPKFDDAQTQAKAWTDKIANGDVLLLNQDEAMTYVPGERELSADGFFRAAKKAISEGDKAKAKELFAKAYTLVQQDLEAME